MKILNLPYVNAQVYFPEILFTRFHRFTMHKVENDQKRGHKSDGKQKIRARLFFHSVPYMKFQDLPLIVIDRMQSVTQTRMHARTDKPITICPLNFFDVWVIKRVLKIQILDLLYSKLLSFKQKRRFTRFIFLTWKTFLLLLGLGAVTVFA